jgi:hypothetical protein
MVAGLALIVGTIPIGLAEVAIEGVSSSVIVLGIIEGPDPIPQVLWEPVREIDPALVLNRDGAIRGDGRPDITYDPATGRPFVVWDYNNGGERDIAYSEWLGTAWAPVRFLSTGSEDERDPRAFVEPDGRVQVVWWVTGVGRVERVEREDGRWSAPETVVASGAERPSIAVWQDSPSVTWERPIAGGGGREIVLSRRSGPDMWTSDVIFTSPRVLPLDSVIHINGGTQWVDWKHAPTALAWSRHDGVDWPAPASVPWDSSTWLGEHAARELARAAALAAP